MSARFQSFEDASDSKESAGRVGRLRAVLEEAGVDGFVVPRADEHQGEYIPPSAARLGWLTGFTGSAGTAVVLPDRAALLVDGRYTVQAREQLDLAVFTPGSSVGTPLGAWLAEHAKGLRVGFDPWLHTSGEVETLAKQLREAGGALVPLRRNPVDRIWQDRPLPPVGAIRVHDVWYSGADVGDKLKRLVEALEASRADAAVLTDPSSVAWTFNIRGSDVPHTPLPLSFAVLRRDGRPVIFVDPRKLDDVARRHLELFADLAEPDRFEAELRALSRDRRVLLDPALAADRIREIVEEGGGDVVKGADPARLPRARKNDVEIEGARRAHLRDGAAMCAFLAWLDRQTPGTVDEIAAVERLERCRREVAERDGMPLRDISFDTISGAGPNAALPHYRVNRASNRTIAAGELFLIDSGGQYDDGTTDITRTVAVGPAGEEARTRFTQVLKGMIAVSLARFPTGTRGIDLDPLARVALWRAGCDYAHGTGHGVGSFLAVHEGPQSISRRGMAVLEAGMIVSNEPGYYREGQFGIRIENLVLVREPEAIPGGDLPMHGFETLTFVPIDRRLIVASLLSDEERDWIDRYHCDVFERMALRLGAEDREWLAEATRPL